MRSRLRFDIGFQNICQEVGVNRVIATALHLDNGGPVTGDDVIVVTAEADRCFPPDAGVQRVVELGGGHGIGSGGTGDIHPARRCRNEGALAVEPEFCGVRIQEVVVVGIFKDICPGRIIGVIAAAPLQRVGSRTSHQRVVAPAVAVGYAGVDHVIAIPPIRLSSPPPA